MMGAFGATELVIILLVYFLPTIFIIWITYCFVKAHEKMAEGIEQIKDFFVNKSQN